MGWPAFNDATIADCDVTVFKRAIQKGKEHPVRRRIELVIRGFPYILA